MEGNGKADRGDRRIEAHERAGLTSEVMMMAVGIAFCLGGLLIQVFMFAGGSRRYREWKNQGDAKMKKTVFLGVVLV